MVVQDVTNQSSTNHSHYLSNTSLEATDIGKVNGVLISMASFIGFIGNFLVLLVSFNTCRHLSVCKQLIAYLALSDFCCSILQTFFIPLELNGFIWIYPNFFCKILNPLTSLGSNVASGIVVAITAERYHGIVTPFKPRWSHQHANFAMLIIWIFSFAGIVPNIKSLNVVLDNNSKNKYCLEHWPNERDPKIYSLVVFVIYFTIPLLIVSFLNFVIILHLKNRNHLLRDPDLHQNAQSLPRVANACQIKRDNVRRIKLLIAVTIMFAICTLPNKLQFVVYDFKPDLFSTRITYIISQLVQILYYFRVAVNPLLYAVVDKLFRRNVRKIICRASKRSINPYREGHHIQSFAKQDGSDELSLQAISRRFSVYQTGTSTLDVPSTPT